MLFSHEDVLAAADRIVQSYSAHGPDSRRMSAEDCNTVASAIRSLVRDDDGDEVTKEWYESVGGRYADDGTYSIDLPYREVSLVFYPKGVTASHPQVWLWVPSGVVVSVNNTRGHVRRLCAALGAPLKETK